MIFEFPRNKKNELLHLFKEHKYMEAIILGTFMSDLGRIFVDDMEEPKNALFLYTGMTVAVFGGTGEGESAKTLIKKIPENTGILCPNDNWTELVKEHFGEKLISIPRTKLSSANLDIKKIRELKKNIPDGYEVKKISEAIIKKFSDHTKRKFVRWFGSLDRFSSNGYGFCALYNGEIAAIAVSGCFFFENAFEIDIVTQQEHRRKGLATLVAAYLIEHALEQGHDPRWDAANEPSVALALRLGYTNPEKYEVIFLKGD